MILITEDIVLYSTGCPKCEVLKAKLSAKGITFAEKRNVKEMLALGFAEAPKLMVNGNLLDFSAAIQWVNEQ